MPNFRISLLTVVLVCSLTSNLSAQRVTESIGRGLVAIPLKQQVFLSWRLLATEPQDTAFNFYRHDKDEPPKLLNAQPLTAGTNFVNSTGPAQTQTFYSVTPAEPYRGPSGTARVWSQGYWEIPFQVVEGYRAGDASIADLDGDGEFEIVLHQVKDPRDNSHSGITGTPILDAYEMDGTLKWRIDLGKNIREGEHYTQFMVYDLDGDGCAELACKTADVRRPRRTAWAQPYWGHHR
jgi:rhamnogalacturonan endolyase